MDLRKYCKTHNLSQEKFAELIGVTPTHVCLIIKGKRNPSIQLVERIEVLTNGKVTLNDLIHPAAPSRLKSKNSKNSKGLGEK